MLLPLQMSVKHQRVDPTSISGETNRCGFRSSRFRCDAGSQEKRYKGLASEMAGFTSSLLGKEVLWRMAKRRRLMGWSTDAARTGK